MFRIRNSAWRPWRPSELEKRTGQTARLTAETEAARIPWRQLHEPSEKYVQWDAFVLWVRAIEDTEGHFPEWLAKVADKRCRGFSKDGRNPTTRTVLGRKQWKRERRILSDDQFRLLLAALPTHIQLMVWTAVSTGMRVSEVLGLRWRSVDLDRGLVSVIERYYRGDADEPKTERARRELPLGCLMEAYRRHKPADAKGDGYVFEKDGNPLDDRAIPKDFIRPAAKRLGFYSSGFGWRSFRRQNLTRIQEEGATPFEA